MSTYADDTDFLRIGYYELAKSLFSPVLSGQAIDIGGNSSGVWQEHLPRLTWHYTPPYPEFNVENMWNWFHDDCLTLTSANPLYDYAFLDQVLEHVKYPQKALEQIKSCMEPGGWLYVATPFFVHYHQDPIHDYWRFTREGLEVLLQDAGFNHIQMGSWGNSRAAQISATNWTTWGQVVKSVGEHEALNIVQENDTSRPIVVFAKAKAPGLHKGEL